jgi:putative transposase
MGPRRENTAMYERTTSQGTASIPTWETLHTWLRGRMQELVQWALEAEVTELLGRARYQRRGEVDGVPGYRNGYGKPRKLTTPVGTVTLRRPRVRGLEERFVSRILPLFARRTKEVGELLPELWRRGTLTWPYGGCWGKRLLFQPVRWPG